MDKKFKKWITDIKELCKEEITGTVKKLSSFDDLAVVEA